MLPFTIVTRNVRLVEQYDRAVDFDTNKYFVVCSNVLGGCMGSTGPDKSRDRKSLWINISGCLYS